jgi:hypothetical protein
MADARPNNKRLAIVLAVGGVAIALFAAYSLLSGGGDDDPAVAPASTQTADITHGGTPTTPSTTAPGAPEIPSGEFDVFATRNPFEPAIQLTDTSSDPPQTGPTDGGTTPPPEPAPADPTTPASPDPSGGTAVAVIDVYDEAGATLAVVQVGSTQYTVAAGQVFATSYKVVSLSGTCGQFMYGDSPFSLCEGEQVIK